MGANRARVRRLPIDPGDSIIDVAPLGCFRARAVRDGICRVLLAGMAALEIGGLLLPRRNKAR